MKHARCRGAWVGVSSSGGGVQKTTQLSATRRLAAALCPRFVPLRCNLPTAQHAHVPGRAVQ
eukprot:288357-Prymnesium_polylepis.1